MRAPDGLRLKLRAANLSAKVSACNASLDGLRSIDGRGAQVKVKRGRRSG
jgi:hypothetical protein